MVLITNILASAVAIAGVVQGVVAQNHFAVTGVETGGTAIRHELRELQSDHPVMWNLFILAMERFQNDKQSNKASYYEIAGIHGAPFRGWDGVGNSGESGVGFCPHSSNLFATWHRPYLALFEQRLAFWARALAEQFPAGSKRQANLDAAHKMRLPFWDWAKSGQRDMPLSLVQKTIKVTRPNGKSVKIRNPLYSYHFHPMNTNDIPYAPQNTWSETKRAPDGTAPNAQSNNAAVESTFKQMRPSLKSAVYDLLSRGGKFNKISNWGVGVTGNNFEAIHNNIHAGCGDNSNMKVVPISSYDPIFWLHHANVDRLVAIWQYLYPATFVKPTSQKNSAGTWTVKKNSKQGPKSALTPFHRNENNNQFWTSDSSRHTGTFHYTYPELAGNPSKATVRAKVNRLYGSASGVSAGVATKLKAKRGLSDFMELAEGLDFPIDINPGELVKQFSAQIAMPQTLPDSEDPYTIMVFLGEITEENPALWKLDPSFVGMQASLGNMMGADVSDVVSYSNVILTQSILSRFAAGDLEDLDEDTVTDFLDQNLHWRVVQNGVAVAKGSAPDIELHLLVEDIKAPEGEFEFPTFLEINKLGLINGTLPEIGL